MLTHRWTPSIERHLARFRSEAGEALPVYHVHSLSADDEALPEGCVPDIVVRPSDAASLLPRRVSYAERRGVWLGSADRFVLPAMMGALDQYDYVWFVEYDVDYAGHWADFFRSAGQSRGDYLATNIRRRSKDPGWAFWDSLHIPDSARGAKQIASFHPIARFSRSLLKAYVRAVEREGWDGHTEALYPSIAVHAGLKVVDLGGRGPFVPRGWEERHYRATMDPTELSTGFGYRPPVSYEYFHEAPENFPDRDWLQHPVKEYDGWDWTCEIPSRRPLLRREKVRREIRRVLRQIAGLPRA
mgnify:CR=1 FL=1